MDQLSGLQPSLLAHQQEVLSQGGSSGRSTPSSDSAPGKLFVGGLSWQTTQARALCILYSRHFWDNSYMKDKTRSRHKQFLVSCECRKLVSFWFRFACMRNEISSGITIETKFLWRKTQVSPNAAWCSSWVLLLFLCKCVQGTCNPFQS